MKSITMQELHEHSKTLGSRDLILDVRTPQEFADGHVPGAKNIPVDQVEARAQELQGTQQLYVYCRAGRRADVACSILQTQGLNRLGIANLFVVDEGGFPDWEDDQLPIEK